MHYMRLKWNSARNPMRLGWGRMPWYHSRYGDPSRPKTPALNKFSYVFSRGVIAEPMELTLYKTSTGSLSAGFPAVSGLGFDLFELYVYVGLGDVQSARDLSGTQSSSGCSESSWYSWVKENPFRDSHDDLVLSGHISCSWGDGVNLCPSEHSAPWDNGYPGLHLFLLLCLASVVFPCYGLCCLASSSLILYRRLMALTLNPLWVEETKLAMSVTLGSNRRIDGIQGPTLGTMTSPKPTVVTIVTVK